MTTTERFQFNDVVPNYFPATIPWDLVGTMGRKVLQKQLDLELGIMATYLVGCALTVTATNRINLPTVFNSASPFAECPCTDETCRDLADRIFQIEDQHKQTTGLAETAISPAVIFTLIQLAMQILAMIRSNKS